MPTAPEPDRGGMPNAGNPAGDRITDPGGAAAEEQPMVPSDAEAETVVINTDPDNESEMEEQPERRFTAPGFDAKETEIIPTGTDPETEVIPKPRRVSMPRSGGPVPAPPPVPGLPPRTAVPQSIPARDGINSKAASRNQKLGWALAIVVIVLALTAIAILLMVLLTKHHTKASEEDRVRQTIRRMDTALQSGDLATLRSITCGATRDGYVDYDERSWQETYQRVAAAKRIPVIDTIDEVAVNGQHAEANVTTYMPYDPQVRSTRSFDLQFRDDQWKVCQSPSG
jgi:hypothetical protein